MSKNNHQSRALYCQLSVHTGKLRDVISSSVLPLIVSNLVMIISVAGILTFSFLCKVAMLSARRSPPIKVGLLYFDLTSLIAELAYCEYADIMNACSVLSTGPTSNKLRR
jgi:hypothetical protein